MGIPEEFRQQFNDRYTIGGRSNHIDMVQELFRQRDKDATTTLEELRMNFVLSLQKSVSEMERVDPVALALKVHDRYTEFATKIYANRDRRDPPHPDPKIGTCKREDPVRPRSKKRDRDNDTDSGPLNKRALVVSFSRKRERKGEESTVETKRMDLTNDPAEKRGRAAGEENPRLFNIRRKIRDPTMTKRRASDLVVMPSPKRVDFT